MGQTTDSRLHADDSSPRMQYSARVHTSVSALYRRSSIGRHHVKRRARTTGTQLDLRPFDCVTECPVRALGGVPKLRGVPFMTRRCKAAPLLQQSRQNSSDASCSSNVDVYQAFSPPSRAWLKATIKASRHRCCLLRTTWPRKEGTFRSSRDSGRGKCCTDDADSVIGGMLRMMG